MAGINTGRVVAGGLVAGLVFNVGDSILNGFVLAEDFGQTVTKLGLDPARLQTLAGVLPWIVIDFLFGLLTVWVYAAIRPRFGPGPKTAVLAGLVPYVAATLLFCGFTSMGIFPVALFVRVTLFAIPHFLIGSIAGAWMYAEA
jgi:hypothetical protein